MGLITEAEAADYGLNRLTKKAIVDSCKKNKLYVTPELNDVLYLHFQGYQKIEALEEYIGLKCLWLESNAITEITGLNNQTLLRCLFLHNNLIEKIENLEACKELDTLNLSHNQVGHIDNCGSDILPVLNTLNLANNYLRTAQSIEILRNCHHLSVLDLSNNRLDDILIVKIFADMSELKVLVLTGNPVVNEIPSYRKTLIVECKKLTYLDTRPIFPRDRSCAEAWKRGGYQEEKRENIRWNKEERREMLRSVNATLKMRNRGGGEPEVQLIPTDSSDDDEYYGREMRPKPCEDVSSTEQWNIMDEMMRNPESADKYQNCKVCGSAFCKFQHIDGHAVKDVVISTEEIIETSNFSILWGEDINTATICQDYKNEMIDENFEEASCSYTNGKWETKITYKINEATDICSTGSTTEISAECQVQQNISELIKISMFPEDYDSDHDSNDSIIDYTEVVFNMVDNNKMPPITAETAAFPVAKKKYAGQCVEDETCSNITDSLKNFEHLTETATVNITESPEMVQIFKNEKLEDEITMNTMKSPKIDGNLTENEVSQLFVEEEHNSDQTAVHIVEVVERVEQFIEYDTINHAYQMVEDDKIDTSSDEYCINVDETVCCYKAKSRDEQTFKSTDLSTLWEENSLSELDENNSKIECGDNGQIKFSDSVEAPLALCSINIDEASCSYHPKSDDPIKENVSKRVNVNHAVIETIENDNSEILINFKCNIPKIESAEECTEDNLVITKECNVNTEFKNLNLTKQLENDFLLSRIKKNCFELNEMLESTSELNKPVNVSTMEEHDAVDEDEPPDEFDDIDNSSKIETLGYSTFVASFEKLFNGHELQSAELMKTIDFSSLSTPENDSSMLSVKVEEKIVCNSPNVDEIPAMKNFREYRTHLKNLLHRDNALRESCNELLNEITDQLEMIEAIDKPLEDDAIELPINPNNSLITPSNSFYKICYDDPNSSLEFVPTSNDIEGNNTRDGNLDAVEEAEDDESNEI